MDERKKYAAISLSMRGAEPKKTPSARIQIGPVKISFSVEAPFAEIEYDAGLKSIPSVPPPQRVSPRAYDPIREKFFHMRSLASGISFARNDPELFYRQAQFMEDFEDDYHSSAKFFMYYPCYQFMGYEQLRTYFTWRTKVRRGDIQPISLSYVFVYIYELLSCVGVDGPLEALQVLMAIWNAFGETEKTLNQFMPEWLRDFHIYYDLRNSFREFIFEYNLQKYYADLLLSGAGPDDSLSLFNGMSCYDIAKSKFYTAGNEGLMGDCFYGVLEGIRDMCARHNTTIEEFWTERTRRTVLWYPFQRALFYPWFRQRERRVTLPGQVYTYKDDRWTIERQWLYAGRRELIGYLIKKTEACLRQALKYKHKITAKHDAFQSGLVKLNTLKITPSELDETIEKSVADFLRNRNRTVVVVNPDNLSRIRMEALGTQDKLTVPEEEVYVPTVAIPAQTHQPEAEGWAAFWEALSTVEGEAISLMLKGGGDMRAFADENNVMLEVLADSINEKAADYIGDSIIELADDMEIYDEYRENLTEMVG